MLHHQCLSFAFERKMPQENGDLPLVSAIDCSEGRTILDLTAVKQKQLRRQRTPILLSQLLLKRTYAHVCQLLDSECSLGKSLPLATVDTNKRKLFSSSDDDAQVPSNNKKNKGLMDKDILQFLRELNAVKVTPRY